MENKSHALAAGTFVLVVSALLVALAVWLTRDTRDLRVYELSSMEPVTGLQPQAAVRFKGVDVGKVTAIGFDPLAPGHVLIRIAIDDQAPITPSSTIGLREYTGCRAASTTARARPVSTTSAQNESPSGTSVHGAPRPTSAG